VKLDNGASASLWAELVHVDGDDTEIVASYASGPVAGGPAITRHGGAWYVSTRLAPVDLRHLIGQVCHVAGARPAGQTAPESQQDVEVVRRAGDGVSWLLAINHGCEPARLIAHGAELLSGAAVDGSLLLPPGEIAVVRET
jgi:beta-galactosidase